MTFSADTAIAQEFMTGEALPLATIHTAVLEFARDRDDVVLFGAQAVNAYVGEPRMTQDVDLLSTRARDLAEELRAHLSGRFNIAVRVREIGEGHGFRLYQLQKTGNRHLVDLRAVATPPPSQRIAGILVVTPAELIAGKVVSYAARRGQPKAGTDWRDLALLLLTFPQLKTLTGPVQERLLAAGAGETVLAVWRELVEQEFQAGDEDDEF